MGSFRRHKSDDGGPLCPFLGDLSVTPPVPGVSCTVRGRFTWTGRGTGSTRVRTESLPGPGGTFGCFETPVFSVKRSRDTLRLGPTAYTLSHSCTCPFPRASPWETKDQKPDVVEFNPGEGWADFHDTHGQTHSRVPPHVSRGRGSGSGPTPRVGVYGVGRPPHPRPPAPQQNLDRTQVTGHNWCRLVVFALHDCQGPASPTCDRQARRVHGTTGGSWVSGDSGAGGASGGSPHPGPPPREPEKIGNCLGQDKKPQNSRVSRRRPRLAGGMGRGGRVGPGLGGAQGRAGRPPRAPVCGRGLGP